MIHIVSHISNTYFILCCTQLVVVYLVLDYCLDYCIDVADCRLCADAWLAGTEMLTGSWVRAGGSL